MPGSNKAHGMTGKQTQLEIETKRMECARDLLQQIVDDHRPTAITPEGAALISTVIVTITMLEHEIGRRLTGKLSRFELADRQTIDELELFVRTFNSLKNADINTVGDLIRLSPKELLKLPNFGRRALNDVRQRLKEHGVTWP